MKTEAIFGIIIFPNDECAIVQHIAARETIIGQSIEECQEIAEHNASYYNRDWIIPDFYKGKIVWECLE